MARVLIIAYGNPLRSDDGLAWHAAERLQQDLPSEAEIVCAHQLTPELAETLGRVDVAILMDASQTGEPGALACDTVEIEPGEIHFSHQLTPTQLVSLANQLYGTTPRVFCVSMCGACFDHGEFLSPQVAQAMPHLVTVVKTLLERTSAAPAAETVQS